MNIGVSFSDHTVPGLAFCPTYRFLTVSFFCSDADHQMMIYIGLLSVHIDLMDPYVLICYCQRIQKERTKHVSEDRVRLFLKRST